MEDIVNSDGFKLISKYLFEEPPLKLDAVPCDCNGICDEMCGHSIDLVDECAIYICNSLCNCSDGCSNRLTSSKYSTSVLTTEDKGNGLFASSDIPTCSYLGDYLGEIISLETVKKVYETNKDSRSMNYVLTIRENSINGTLTTFVDSTRYGNVFRFMNHSCSPNVRIVPVRSDWVVPRVTCYTTRDVMRGEELCISYGDNCGSVPCKCGEDTCRGFLPLELF